MKKLAKEIKVGDTVQTWAYWIVVKEITESFQKNGKRLVNVSGDRVFKSESEKKGVVKSWGESALTAVESYKENTKVAYK